MQVTLAASLLGRVQTCIRITSPFPGVQAKLAKLRRELLEPSGSGGGATGAGFDVQEAAGGAARPRAVLLVCAHLPCDEDVCAHISILLVVVRHRMLSLSLSLSLYIYI